MANKGGEIRKTKCMFEKNTEICFFWKLQGGFNLLLLFFLTIIFFLFFAFVWHNFTEQNNYLHFSQT